MGYVNELQTNQVFKENVVSLQIPKAIESRSDETREVTLEGLIYLEGTTLQPVSCSIRFTQDQDETGMAVKTGCCVNPHQRFCQRSYLVNL
ncbi:hypothetical protein TNCV_3108591 [Trichonephila clavipes]|uniref:Uncharacterized protein n=1 Tax=Trichonephila clavipes TaxID=2585209 RepID=A0A8X6S7P8_TRICX|nr:hypothetical protein TNCV_3108591 [Trichonephila clavipes]